MDHDKSRVSSKLCPRHTTQFKKSSKALSMREDTMLKKASELSTLCDSQVCVLQYDFNGQLVKTWPQDQSKVNDIALRYILLSDGDRAKKSTNLSQFLHKKMIEEKKQSLKNKDNKFSQKVSEMDYSLRTRFHVLQDKLLRLHNQSLAVSSYDRL